MVLPYFGRHSFHYLPPEFDAEIIDRVESMVGEALNSSDPQRIGYAASFAGKMGPHGAKFVPRLAEIVKDDAFGDHVRHATEYSICMLAVSSEVAFDAMVELIDSSRLDDGVASAWHMIDAPPDAAEDDARWNTIAIRDEDHQVFARAVLAFTREPELPCAIVKKLIQAAEERPGVVAVVARTIAIRCQCPEVVPFVARALENWSVYVQIGGARAAGELGARGESLLPALQRMVDEFDPIDSRHRYAKESIEKIRAAMAR